MHSIILLRNSGFLLSIYYNFHLIIIIIKIFIKKNKQFIQNLKNTYFSLNFLYLDCSPTPPIYFLMINIKLSKQLSVLELN